MNTRMRAVVPVLAAAALLAGGCNNSATNTYNEVIGDAPPEGLVVGGDTIVMLRPDVMGVSRDHPLLVGNTSQNVPIMGVLASVDATWLVIDDTGTGLRQWLRLDSVISIEQKTPPERAAPATAAPG